MAKFRVELTTLALMKQTHIVDAKSTQEAEEEALKKYNDEVWQYQGIPEPEGIDAHVSVINYD